VEVLATSMSAITISFGAVAFLAGVGVVLDFRQCKERIARAPVFSAQRATFIGLVGHLWMLIGLLAILFGIITLP